jgi:hypothetical protein
MSDSRLLDAHLEQLLASEGLSKSEHSRRLLRYLVERARLGEAPKEAEIAIDVFGRDASFNGSDDSQVRVAVRTLRLKLDEYYAGVGRDAPVQFHIPKGAYRLVAEERHPAPERPVESPGVASGAGAATPPAPSRHWKTVALVAAGLLAFSIVALITLRPAAPPPTAELGVLAASPIWNGLINSERPLTIVLGDQFMYSSFDTATGRTNMVRDTGINSSEELRRFLAGNPDVAAGRGQHYMSMLQKSTAIGMAEVLQLVSRPDRKVQVRVREEMQMTEFNGTDIIYIGPLSRLGPLAAQFELHSRYRFDRESSGILDTHTGKLHRPEGELLDLHKEFALAARFRSPDGSNVLIITPGGRNSGLMLTINMLTSPASVQEISKQLGAQSSTDFEMLIEVTANRQTDLAAKLLEVYLPAKDKANSNTPPP